ncbi:MAG: ABC transporter ATP-binding protein [Clostridia bacterium]|nr:ABC transporter ATP-binding protein [Clostridia bacterium]
MDDYIEEVEEKEKLKGDKKIPAGKLFARNVKYMRLEWPRFLLSGILIVINVLLDVIMPLVFEKITDSLTAPAIDLKYILVLTAVYLAICIVNNLFLYAESMVLQKAGQNIILKLRTEVFTHIEDMSQNQLNEMPVGSLVTRVTSYTQSMSDLFTQVIVSVIRNVMTIIGVYVIMFTVNVKLSLVMLIPITAVFAASMVFSKVIGRRFRKERKNISDLNSFLSENLSGMRITQIFNREKKKQEEFSEKNENLRRSRFGIIRAFGVYRPLMTFIYVSTMALIFWMGTALGLSPGGIFAFYLCLGKFFNPLQQLADQLNSVQKAMTASERIFNLMDVAPEVRDRPGAVELTDVRGRIEFRHVWFAYEGENWILRDVSFTVEPGQTCAFVGATGAGKTTILGLIVRNYEIQKGQILIDGIDVADIKIKSLRKAVGQMLQDVFLFSGTVKTNISLRDEQIPDADIVDAAKYVGADGFIEKLPHGYDEEIIERGENLSQGQKQLVSFARTVLARPSIMILDEATANIDTETESVIQASLEKMKSIGTMLVVAHRLSTIQHADRIIVLQNGRVTESGTHAELLAQRGYYYKLYLLQFDRRGDAPGGTPAVTAATE